MAQAPHLGPGGRGVGADRWRAGGPPRGGCGIRRRPAGPSPGPALRGPDPKGGLQPPAWLAGGRRPAGALRDGGVEAGRRGTGRACGSTPHAGPGPPVAAPGAISVHVGARHRQRERAGPHPRAHPRRVAGRLEGPARGAPGERAPDPRGRSGAGDARGSRAGRGRRLDRRLGAGAERDPGGSPHGARPPGRGRSSAVQPGRTGGAPALPARDPGRAVPSGDGQLRPVDPGFGPESRRTPLAPHRRARRIQGSPQPPSRLRRPGGGRVAPAARGLRPAGGETRLHGRLPRRRFRAVVRVGRQERARRRGLGARGHAEELGGERRGAAGARHRHGAGRDRHLRGDAAGRGSLAGPYASTGSAPA